MDREEDAAPIGRDRVGISAPRVEPGFTPSLGMAVALMRVAIHVGIAGRLMLPSRCACANRADTQRMRVASGRTAGERLGNFDWA